MPRLPNTDSFCPESYYHIYNHAIGSDNLFRNRNNYLYFLARFKNYMLSVCRCLAYCLMPNHFHFLVQVRTAAEIEAFQEDYKPGQLAPSPDYHKIVMNQFSRMLNGYTQAYNRMFDRKGALFLDYMKRKEVNDDLYMNNLIYYIHHNPVHHNFFKDWRDWEFSSYRSLCGQQATGLERVAVVKRFGTRQDFMEFHEGEQYQAGPTIAFEF
jgi:putative transposase